MLKIEMTHETFSSAGNFKAGEIVTEEQASRDYLLHLVHAVKAAKIISDEPEQKMIKEDYEVKKPQSSQSLPQDKASRKKTAKKRTNKRQSSQ